MQVLWFILIGFAAGILGGMGMGGGTLLIPLLTIFMNVEHNIAQGVNLIAFIPMAIIALIIHKKNNLIEKKGLLRMIIPAIATAIGASLLVGRINNRILAITYGCFIVAAGIFFIIITTINIIKKKRKSRE